MPLRVVKILAARSVRIDRLGQVALVVVVVAGGPPQLVDGCRLLAEAVVNHLVRQPVRVNRRDQAVQAVVLVAGQIVDHAPARRGPPHGLIGAIAVGFGPEARARKCWQTCREPGQQEQALKNPGHRLAG